MVGGTKTFGVERITRGDKPWGVREEVYGATGYGNSAANKTAYAVDKGRTEKGTSPEYRPLVSEAPPGDQADGGEGGR